MKYDKIKMQTHNIAAIGTSFFFKNDELVVEKNEKLAERAKIIESD